jgi:succinate dehydrogenase/fumarate reductase cytochrome b subunit
MIEDPIFWMFYWMFILLLCINGYQHFTIGIVLVVIPLTVYLFKRSAYSKQDTVVWAILTIAAMLATVQSLVGPLFR